MNVIDLYWKGGPVMHAILACSVLGVGFLLERLWFLWRTRADAEEVLFGLRSLLRERKVDDAIAYAQSQDVPISRVVAAILIKYREAGAGANLQRAAEEAALREAPQFERFLTWLSLCASIATLLGLTGTVTGMIGAFGAISHSNMVTPQLVAAGVNEALLTTPSASSSPSR